MYQHILVALDYNNHTEKIGSKAIDTALVYDANLTLCHIKKNTIIYNPVDPTGVLTAPHLFSHDYSYPMDEELERIKKKALKSGLKAVDIVQTYSSSPGLAIAEVIAPGYEADLIICGSSHKSGLDRFLLGSVSTDIAKHAKCDVLLIRNLAD